MISVIKAILIILVSLIGLCECGILMMILDEERKKHQKEIKDDEDEIC